MFSLGFYGLIFKFLILFDFVKNNIFCLKLKWFIRWLKWRKLKIKFWEYLIWLKLWLMMFYFVYFFFGMGNGKNNYYFINGWGFVK